jgi:DNA repair protein RecO (recombination protein O)
MHWADEAIVLSSKKHGENSAIARMFTSKRGVYSGVVRSVHSKLNRGIVHPGNGVSASWNARLSEHLGTFKAELLEPNVAMIMGNALKLAALSSACALMEASLPERHPYPQLYEEFDAFLKLLAKDKDWEADYVKLEMEILAESGFGLDLSKCAATNVTKDLIYVSPKSGRSVCREAGEPYASKLLPLPAFLLPKPKKNAVSSAEILEGLRLTGYFLGAWLLVPNGKKLPAARTRLIHMMKEKHGEAQTTAA